MSLGDRHFWLSCASIELTPIDKTVTHDRHWSCNIGRFVVRLSFSIPATPTPSSPWFLHAPPVFGLVPAQLFHQCGV